jgi:hypothetical protein
VKAPVRTLATSYPYDAHLDGQMSLRMSVNEIAHKLRDEIQERVATAGVEVIEARITHLSYAPEIAECHAAAPAGKRNHCRPLKNCRRRRRHGRNGVGAAKRQSTLSNSMKSARPAW